MKIQNIKTVDGVVFTEQIIDNTQNWVNGTVRVMQRHASEWHVHQGTFACIVTGRNSEESAFLVALKLLEKEAASKTENAVVVTTPQSSVTAVPSQPVVVQKWEESERGWGTRPDGYTLHLNMKDRDRYIKEFNAKLPDEPPECYSRPCGKPYIWDAPPDTVQKLLEAKDEFGLAYASNAYPGSQGTDGWKS